MDKCDILLFGTMADIGATVRDDLTGHGFKVALKEFAQNTPRDFCGYRRELLKAVAELHPRLVIPIGNNLAMARIADEAGSSGANKLRADEECGNEGGFRAIVADWKAVAMLDGKVSCYEFAAGLGILQPRRYTFDEVLARECGSDGKTDAPDLGIIFKRDISFGGSGVHRPRNISSLRHLIEHENGTQYLIEEYIDGEDISIDCIRGETYFRAGAYISLGRNYTQGPAVQRRSIECPEAERIARTMLDSLDYKGVCGLDFRRSADGKLYLLECNPRLTGGLRTQIENGFDIPYELVKAKRACGETVSQDTAVR